VAADALDSRGGPFRSPVVVGLGNPGRRYAKTRHNVGFLVADELAGRYGGRWKRAKRAEVSEIDLGPYPVTLVKPQTYMNNSGQAVGTYGADRLIVVHDDLDLDAGVVRVKVGGGPGGHNGLRSIIGQLGREFVRVRVGVGRPEPGYDPRDYVLSNMDAALREAVPRAADAVEAVIEQGPEAAMNRFNVRNPKPAE
jgi:PTH1 family peptidyl-tRNA hydrolase